MVGNGSTNTASVNQSPVVVVDHEQPIVITGGTGTTKVTVQLGGTVGTTITAIATNASDGAGQVSTAVAVNTSGSVKVTSDEPVTIGGTTAGASGPPGRSATIAIGNGSTNLVLVAQSPSVTVIQNIPIELDHPSGDVTINAVIDGMVITNVTGTASNTSSGSAQLSAGLGSGTAVVGDLSAIPSLIANGSINTVVVIQTPTITVICTIPIVVIDPQGPVAIHAAIAGVVTTNITGNAVNGSDGNATLNADNGSASTTAANLVGNESTNTIVMVQAPTVTVLQSIPITVVDPHAPVSIDASIGGSVTTTMNGNAVNLSNGRAVVVVGSGSGSGSHTAVGNESTNDIELSQNPQVTVTSDIPVSVTDPNGLVIVHTTKGTIVSTQVRSSVQNVSTGVATFMPRGTNPGGGTGKTGDTGSTGGTGKTGGTRGEAANSGSNTHHRGTTLPVTTAAAHRAVNGDTPVSADLAAPRNVGSTSPIAITHGSRASTDDW
jgi:hypothetical protein